MFVNSLVWYVLLRDKFHESWPQSRYIPTKATMWSFYLVLLSFQVPLILLSAAKNIYTLTTFKSTRITIFLLPLSFTCCMISLQMVHLFGTVKSFLLTCFFHQYWALSQYLLIFIFIFFSFTCVCLLLPAWSHDINSCKLRSHENPCHLIRIRQHTDEFEWKQMILNLLLTACAFGLYYFECKYCIGTWHPVLWVVQQSLEKSGKEAYLLLCPEFDEKITPISVHWIWSWSQEN